MNTSSATPIRAIKYALYYRPGGRRRRAAWTLHDVFGTEAEAWARVKDLPFRSLDYWVTPLPAGTVVCTEMTPESHKKRTRPATTPRLF